MGSADVSNKSIGNRKVPCNQRDFLTSYHCSITVKGIYMPLSRSYCIVTILCMKNHLKFVFQDCNVFWMGYQNGFNNVKFDVKICLHIWEFKNMTQKDMILMQKYIVFKYEWRNWRLHTGKSNSINATVWLLFTFIDRLIILNAYKIYNYKQ